MNSAHIYDTSYSHKNDTDTTAENGITNNSQ
jgi:hypothetical protein